MFMYDVINMLGSLPAVLSAPHASKDCCCISPLDCDRQSLKEDLQNLDYLKNMTTLHDPDSGLISEVPL